MKKEVIKDLIIFISCFVLYYIFGTGLIYLILRNIYKGNSEIFPSCLMMEEFTQRGLSNIAQFISSIIILIVLIVIYFRWLKDSFAFFKNYKAVFKTIGYALLIYFVTICYNLFLPFVGGSGEDGSNVELIKESMKNQYWIMLLLVVVLGPVIEELLFRFIPFKCLKKRMARNWLLIVSTILFTVPHLFSLVNSGDLLMDLIAVPKFFIIGWMLGSYYYKNEDIGRVIFVHMVYNMISFVLMSLTLSLI